MAPSMVANVLVVSLVVWTAVHAQSASCVAVGEGSTSSASFSLDDGNTFLAAAGALPSFSGQGVAVQDDAGLTNPQWIAVGRGPKAVEESDDADPWLFSSNDGRAWLGPITNLPLTGTLRSVWYSAVYQRFVITGCCGPLNAFRSGNFTLAHSQDGMVWTGIRAFDLLGLDVTYSAQRDLWVALGDSPVSRSFSVAYIQGSPVSLQWTRTADVTNLLTTARGIAYSITHDLWFVVGFQTAALQASILFTRDPLDITQWRPVAGSGSTIFPQGFRIASFNGTVVAGGGNFGPTPTTTAVFDSQNNSPLQTPVFKPSAEGASFFNRTRGVVRGASPFDISFFTTIEVFFIQTWDMVCCWNRCFFRNYPSESRPACES